jgi:hypothetical protein
VIGRLAAVAHGSRRVTRDIDIVEPGNDNLALLEQTLAELGAVKLAADAQRQAIEPADVAMIVLGATLHASSPAGRLDVVGKPAGAARFEQLRARSIVGHLGGVEIRVSGLDDPIAMKRAAGRPLDLQEIADLTAATNPP